MKKFAHGNSSLSMKSTKKITVCWMALTWSNLLGFAKTNFSDEFSFHLNGNVNRHNLFYYSKENEHLTIVRPLKSAAITVWAAVSYYHDLTIMDQTVNSERSADSVHKSRSFHWAEWNLPTGWGTTSLHSPCKKLAQWAPSWTLDWETWISRMAAQIAEPDFGFWICDFWLWSYAKENVIRSKDMFTEGRHIEHKV